jgi:hypothetical protein
VCSQEKFMSQFSISFAEQARPLKRKNLHLATIQSAARVLATTGLVALLIGLGWIFATGDDAALTRLIGMV